MLARTLAHALNHALGLALALGVPVQAAQTSQPATPGFAGPTGLAGPALQGAVAHPPQPPQAPQASTIDDAKYDSDAALPAHADSVVTYEIHASLDPQKHTVHGEGTLQWRNTSNVPVHEIWMHLYLNAFKNQRSTFLSEPIGGFRGNEPVNDWGYIDVQKLAMRGQGGSTNDLWSHVELRRNGSEDETDARLPLPRDVAPNETITLDMAWDDKLPSVVERTGYLGSFHMIAQWFPKIARLEPDGKWAHFPFHHLAEFYADYGTYDVTLDTPQSFVIGATGPVIDSRIEGGRRIERHVQTDVHDFAWTAWDQWQSQTETIDGVHVTVLYPPNFRVDAQREIRSMRFALPHFNARYGRYPYDVLTLVHPPDRAREAGGMEYPTLITTGGPWYGPPGVFAIENVTIHEYGHQYFYGLIGTNEVEWPFLDEGMNSFAEQVALDEWRGAGSIVDLAGLRVSDASLQSVIGNGAAHDAPVAQAAYAFKSGTDYGALVYGRTSTIFETFRRVYGDELVGRAIGRYARKYRYGHPVPDDLLATFGEVLGVNAAKTLRTALFDEGWVNFKIESISSRASHDAAGIFDRDGTRETVTRGSGGGGFEGWVLVVREGTLAFPVDIELTRADGTTERVHWAGDEQSTRIPYRGDVALRSAIIDPDHAVLLDQTLTDNFATAMDQPKAGARRTLERMLYWMEIAIQAVLP